MKIVFMGTPDFAVPTLDRLVKEHEVVAVYTRAPKEAGRGHELKKSSVHIQAEKHNIDIYTPKTLKTEEAQKEFRSLKADIAVVAAYGLILPKAVIEAFKYGALNVHASLLPRWRGAAPIQRAIEAGDKESGVTIMQIVEQLDAGQIYQKGIVLIDSDTTGGILHDQLSLLGADLMSDVLKNIDTVKPLLQDETLVTYAKKIEKEEEKLDFSLSAEYLERKIRAFNPFPATYFEYKGERFKVLKAVIVENEGLNGEIIDGKSSLIIACQNKALKILSLQRQGKKAMSTEELLRGFEFEKGFCLA